MPKFLKLFRRKTKGSSSDPAAAGILSDGGQGSQQQQLPAKGGKGGGSGKPKKEKKLSRRQAKKQKKQEQDRLASFPSGGRSSSGVALGDGEGGEGGGGWDPEEQKENLLAGAQLAGRPAAGSPPQDRTGASAFDGGGSSSPPQPQYEPAGFYEHGDAIYDKPALSVISEERSPRNGAALSPSAHSGGPGGATGGRRGGGFPDPAHPPSHPQAPPSTTNSALSSAHGSALTTPSAMSASAASAGSLLSPMSMSKPPLTPNRILGHRNSSGMSQGSGGSASPGSLGGSGAGVPGSVNLTPSQYRTPGTGHGGHRGPHPHGGHSSLSSHSGGHSPGSKSSATSGSGGGAGGLLVDPTAAAAENPHKSLSPDGESLRGMRLAGSEEMMCLSADEEDEEYNRLTSSGAKDGNGGGSGGRGGGGKDKFVSALDRGPFGYGAASEEDADALFPALVEDKDPWTHQGQGHGQGHPGTQGRARPGSGRAGARTPGPEGRQPLDILPMAHETQEDMRAWTPSPTKKGAFTFQGGVGGMGGGERPAGGAGAGAAGGGAGGTGVGGPGPGHIQVNRSHGHGHGGSGGQNKVLFENFADFEPFDPSGTNQFESQTSQRGGASPTPGAGSSRSVAHSGSSPVSALLEDSRARRRSNGQRSVEGGGHRSIEGGPLPRLMNGAGTGSSSINSAPVLTPSHVRGLASRGGPGATSSLSRVIDNLELHVNKPQGGGSTAPRGGGGPTAGNMSVDCAASRASNHSRSESGASAGPGGRRSDAVREAKERIRRENLMGSEGKVIDMLAAGGGAAAVAGSGKDGWLFDEVAGTLGPRSVAADLESLGGRSGKSRTSLGGKSHKSGKSHRSHRSKKSRGGRRHRSSRHADDGMSVDSRNSYRSYQTTKSMVSQMSEQSRSVANDLLRLEAQLSMVGKTRNGGAASGSGGASGPGASGGSSVGPPSALSSKTSSEMHKRRDDCGMTVTSRDFSVSRSGAPRSTRHLHHHHVGSSSVSSHSRGGEGRSVPGSIGHHHGGHSRGHISASARRAAARTLRSKVSVVAPPGKLGIILANRTDARGTVVSGVRTSSVLAEQVSPGDRIVAIDEEDVSQMNVKEITTIMARKSEFERKLVLLAAPKVQYD